MSDQPMLASLPPTRAQQLAFFEQHLAAWQASAGDLGLSSEEVAELTARIYRAQAALAAAEAAKQAAKKALGRFYGECTRVTLHGKTLLGKIDAHAQATRPPAPQPAPEPALVAPPVAPAPEPAPLEPQTTHLVELTGTVESDGRLVIRWTLAGAEPTIPVRFAIYRRIGADGDWAIVGFAASTKFIEAPPRHLAVAKGRPIQYRIELVGQPTQPEHEQILTVDYGIASMIRPETIVETPKRRRGFMTAA